MEKSINLIDRGALFSTILNNTEDGIIYYRALRDEKGELIDFIFEFMNDSSLHHIHGTIDDYLGRRFMTTFPGYKNSGLWDAFRKTLETGIPEENIFWYEDIEYKSWFKNKIQRFEDGIIVYFRDVTNKILLDQKLEKKNEQLEKLLKEKDILLQETHHRIKNNLQIVSSMLSLQNSAANKMDPKEVLEVARQRINTIAVIHERLYFDKNFRSINLESFIYDIIRSVNKISEGGKLITYQVDVPELEISINSCINTGLILNELLTNCSKHAFSEQDKGEIKISISKTSEGIELIVKDNGKGLPDGFNKDNLASMGFILVQALVDQMDGTIWVKSDQGTTVTINFTHYK